MNVTWSVNAFSTHFQETRVNRASLGCRQHLESLTGVGVFSLSPSAPLCVVRVYGGAPAPHQGSLPPRELACPAPLTSPELPQTQDKFIGKKLWVARWLLLVGVLVPLVRVLLAAGKAQGWRGSSWGSQCMKCPAVQRAGGFARGEHVPTLQQEPELWAPVPGRGGERQEASLGGALSAPLPHPCPVLCSRARPHAPRAFPLTAGRGAAISGF